MDEIIDSVRNFFKNKINIRFIQTCKRESKNGAQKSRLMVISDYRIFFLLKAPLCVEKFFYLIDIRAIESLSFSKLIIRSPSKTVVVTSDSGFLLAVKEVLICLKSIYSSLPTESLLTTLLMPSAEVLKEVKSYVEAKEIERLPCGNFSTSYRCMCDYHNFPCLEDVIWDIEAIYFLHDTKDFNFRDFDYLDNRYYLPVLSALQFNSYFIGLNLSNVKLTQSSVLELAKILKQNFTLKQLNLSNSSLKTSYIEKLCEALSQNLRSSISFLDLSKNNLDDKSVLCISSLKTSWEGLILNEASISQNGMAVLFNSLVDNEKNFSSLVHLDLSRNSLKKEGLTTVLNFLSIKNSIEKLNLECCDVPLENLFGRLLDGCTENLQELNLSGNNLNKKKLTDQILMSWKQFFSSSNSLRFLDLSNCHLTSDALKHVLLGLSLNKQLVDVNLKLSGNSFDSKSVDVFEVCLPVLSTIHSLDLSSNNFNVEDFKILFDKLALVSNLKKLYIGKNLQNSKAKNLIEAVEAIVSYLRNDNVVLECLHIDEMFLKSEALPFLNHLGGDTHLNELNLSSNGIGTAGAYLLSKALQINCTLKKIIIDKNDISIPALYDIAHALSRNYFLKSFPLPLHDIMTQQKINPERMDKLEEVIKKIEMLINRNNSPSLLLADKTFAAKLHLSQLPLLNNLKKASDELRVLIDKVKESMELEGREHLKNAENMLKEAALFIKIYNEFLGYLKQRGALKRESSDELFELMKKLSFSGSAYQTECVHSLWEYVSKICPTHFDEVKKSLKLENLRLQEMIISPILSQIMLNTEQTLNNSMPYAALEMLKVISNCLVSNLEESASMLLNKEYLVPNDEICRAKNNSDIIRHRRDTAKDEMKMSNDGLPGEDFMRTLKKVRPISTLKDGPDPLYLPVHSDSLEHLALQRPKPMKNHKAVVPVVISPDDDITPLKAPVPSPRLKSGKATKSISIDEGSEVSEA